MAEFLAAYNEELRGLSCAARVGPANGNWHLGSMEVFDKTGMALGIIANTIAVTAFPAIVTMVERAYQRGLQDGQQMTTPT